MIKLAISDIVISVDRLRLEHDAAETGERDGYAHASLFGGVEVAPLTPDKFRIVGSFYQSAFQNGVDMFFGDEDPPEDDCRD